MDHDSSGGLDDEIEFDGNIHFNAQNLSQGVQFSFFYGSEGSCINFDTAQLKPLLD